MDVSIIIPVRNREEFLVRAITSVFEQSYSAYELIVIDDGSDRPLGAAQALVEEAGHCWIQQTPRGVSAARNRGVAAARYDWIAFLDSDDRWKSEKLKKQVHFHLHHPEILISQTDEEWYRYGRWVNKKKYHRLAEGDGFKDSLELCCISPSSVLLHRTVLKECGVFDERFPVCEDYELWLRVAARYQIGLISEKLIEKYGGHSDQLSRSLPALDRYRLHAILKLLIFAYLTEAQQSLAVDAALRRTHLLALGAKKHAPEHVSIYETIAELLRDGHFRQALSFVTSLIP